MTSLHFHPLTVRAVHPDTDDAMVVSFRVPPELSQAFDFQPGQYLTLRQLVDGEDLRRSYSICAAPADGELRVGVRRVAGGLFSTWLHRHLKPGDRIEAMPPQGRFVLAPAAAPRHVLGIAGGSGITPILSILKTLLATEPDSRFTLIYANRRAATTMFKEELEDLKNRYLTRLAIHPVFSREQIDAPLNSGRLDAARLKTFLTHVIPAASVDEAYVCGPHAMNDEMQAALRDAGLPESRIHIERFGVPPAATDAAADAPAEGDAPQAVITVLRDGLSRQVPFAATDGNLLAAAARAGMDVPYSCKSGVCGTCRARLTGGQVRMARNFALEPAEVAAGFVLTCQAHPLTDTVAVSFDDR